MAEYEVWLSKNDGTRLINLTHQVESLQYAKTVNGFGAFGVTLSAFKKFPVSLRPDLIVEIWRTPSQGDNGLNRLQFYGMLRKWEFIHDSATRRRLVLSGVDQNHLLARRIIYAKAGSVDAQVNNIEVDSAMWYVVQKHLTAPTITERTMPDCRLGPRNKSGNKISMSFAYKNLLTVLQEMSQTSRSQGNEIFFALETSLGASGSTNERFTIPTFTFRTFHQFPGKDRRWSGLGSGDASAIFGEEWGTLGSSQIIYDHATEASYILAAGQGEGDGRRWSTAWNEDALQQSRWGWIERFQDARSEEDAISLSAVTFKALADARAKLRIKGRILDVPNSRYGRNWDFGDYITIDVFGEYYDAIIRSLLVKVDSSGKETVDARVETEVYLSAAK